MNRIEVFQIWALCFMAFLPFALDGQIDANGYVSGALLRTNGSASGDLLKLTGQSDLVAIAFAGPSAEIARIHLFGGNLDIINRGTSSDDLITLFGGNGGKFWMYPDGKLYANNLGNIGDHKDMQWNSTTGEIGWDSSTRRHKIQINTLSDDWTKILQTRPVKFTRPASPVHWEYGYIAEEMDSIGLHNLVGYDAEGLPDDVKYEKMVLYLTEMMKILYRSNMKLENEIVQLHHMIKCGCKGLKGS